MKTDRGSFRAGRHEQRMPQTQDAYRPEGRIHDPAECRSCGALFLNGRWTWHGTKPKDTVPVTCPACERIADEMPGGYVTMRGAFFKDHRDEVLALVRARETHAQEEHPLQRIMGVRELGKDTIVTTTDPHLARGIAHALHDAFKGDVTLRYNRSENLVRVLWVR